MAAIHVQNPKTACPYCRDEVDINQPHLVCQKCLTRHHTDCWTSSGSRCAVFGCGSMQALASSPPMGAPMGTGYQPNRQVPISAPTQARGAKPALLIGVAMMVMIGAAGAAMFLVTKQDSPTPRTVVDRNKTSAPAPVMPLPTPQPVPPHPVKPGDPLIPVLPPHVTDLTKRPGTTVRVTRKTVLKTGGSTLTIGNDPLPSGSSNETLQLVIQHASEIGLCSAKRSNTNTRLVFTARLSVRADGSVSAINYSGLPRNELKLGRCLAQTIVKWKLKPGTARTVNLPLTIR